jgi:hypothetical protein
MELVSKLLLFTVSIICCTSHVPIPFAAITVLWCKTDTHTKAVLNTIGQQHRGANTLIFAASLFASV